MTKTKHSEATIQRANEDFERLVRECVAGVEHASSTERLLIRLQVETLQGCYLWAKEKIIIRATEEALAVSGVDYDVVGIIDRVKACYFEQFLEHHY